MRLRILVLWCIASALLSTACTKNGSEVMMPVTTGSDLALEYYETGMLAYDQYKFSLAIENLQKAVKEDPDFFMAQFWLYQMPVSDLKGIAETVLKTRTPLNEAEKHIKSAFKYQMDGQDEKVVEQMEAAIALYPADPNLHKILYIFQYHYLKDPESALESIRRAVEAKSDDGFAHNYLGYALMELGDYNEAEAAFDRYIRLEPELANPYDSKGDYYMATEQYDRAYESYMKAFAIDSYSFKVSEKKAIRAKQMMSDPPL